MAGMVKPTREQIVTEVTKSPGFGHFENPGFWVFFVGSVKKGPIGPIFGV